MQLPLRVLRRAAPRLTTTHTRTVEIDDQLNLRVSSRLRRQLEAAAKRDRRRVTELARIVLQDRLAAHAGDTGSSQP
jgi:hypothetical protein